MFPICMIVVAWLWAVYLLIFVRWFYLREPFPFYRPRQYKKRTAKAIRISVSCLPSTNPGNKN